MKTNTNQNQAKGTTKNLPFNQDKKLKDWFRVYYIKWMETCENLRWVAQGRGEKYPMGLMPFLPFGLVPGAAYNTFLTTFIDSQVCRLDDTLLPDRLGPPGNMVSIIADAGTDVCPYIMFEWVEGGIVTNYAMHTNTTWAEVKKTLTPEDLKICYTKQVSTDFLRQVYALHQQWTKDGDNARYLVEFLITLWKGMDTGSAKIDPAPAMLAHLRYILANSLKLDGIDVGALLVNNSHLIPNFTIATRKGDLPINMGHALTVVIDEQAIYTLLDGLKLHDNLGDLTAYFIGFVAEAMRTGWIKIGGARWLSKLSALFLKRKIHSLPKKIQILTKIMGNPFRLLIVLQDKALLVSLTDGLPTSIETLPLIGKGKLPVDASLEQIWLSAYPDYPFVNLAVRVNGLTPGRLSTFNQNASFSLQDQMEFYPNNDFVRYIMRKGALQVLLDLALPFMKA